MKSETHHWPNGGMVRMGVPETRGASAATLLPTPSYTTEAGSGMPAVAAKAKDAGNEKALVN